MRFFFLPWPSTQRVHLILFVGWIVMTNLTKSHKTKSRKLQLACFRTNFINKTLLGLFPVVPRSRHRVVDILPHMIIVSRASRPGLLVGFLRIHCNGLCTAQRFHTEEHDQTCRVGCPNEPDSLTHYHVCPRLYNIFISFWRHAAILPQRIHFLHDLMTRVFLQSLQYGIVVLGYLDAFVYAHHKHRQGGENPGNFGDCMKGRIRFVTAITPAYAQAYQATCLARHIPAVPHKNFWLPKPKARYPYLPNARSITRERGNDFQGSAIYTDGGIRVVNGETFAGWGAIARFPNGRMDTMFGPVNTTEALRPFTLCNCDCKLLTTAFCQGLHWYTMRCIHPSQRCTSSTQMTDNIFEIETTALAHVACAPQESGILLTDFAAAFPSVNHSWIFSVIEKTELLDYICRFLRSIYNDSTTHEEFAGATRGQFLIARGVRQGCPASGFLFAMAFDPIFRWLQEAVIPRNPDDLDFLQPAQCAYTDDLAVAGPDSHIHRWTAPEKKSSSAC